MKTYLFVFTSLLLINGCGANEAKRAHLTSGIKPSEQIITPSKASKIPPVNPTDEKIRLLKAQTDAKARLAEIEARKAEHLKELDAQRAATVAKIEADKAGQIKRLEVEEAKSAHAARAHAATEKAKTDIALEHTRQQTALQRQHEEVAFYRQLLIAGVVILFLLMLLIYLLYRHRQSLKVKLHDDQLRHQAYLEINRQHHEKVTKVLEIIADEGTDKNLRKELTKLLKDQKGDMPKLIESR